MLQIIERSSTNDLTKLLNMQSRATLIQLIERSPEITGDIIDSAYEKYKITNGLLKKVFSSDSTKRVTKHNSNPPENQLEKITVKKTQYLVVVNVVAVRSLL